MNTPFEKRICLTICICQLTAVLSCVSIVYLTVAVYVPSSRILNSDFDENPVMCTTVSNLTFANCEVNEGEGPSWSSCGEWCLSKSTGGTCTQIRVDVRRNGTNIKLEDCEDSDIKYCDGIDPKKDVHECINNCTTLHGLFNCTISESIAGVSDDNYGSQCRNLTSILTCKTFHLEHPILCNSKKACLNLNGLYECNYGSCARIKGPYACEKRCIGIKTKEKTVIVRAGDTVFTSDCRRAVDVLTGEEVWPKQGLISELDPATLLVFCTNIISEKMIARDNMTDKDNLITEVLLSDCFNGTLLEPGYFGNATNITHLLATHMENDRYLDPLRVIAPPEESLLIYNNTPLYINYEACVNTLILQECEKFHADYGGDGTDLNSQSRFQCVHSPNSSEFVVLRFSKLRTMMELMIASVIPITLAVVSCFTLILCTKIIHVSDDSHFYLHCCGANEDKIALDKGEIEAMPL